MPMEQAKPLTVAVCSSSRADYSHLRWTLQAIEEHPHLTPRLVLFGAHLAPEFGETGRAARDDGFAVAAEIESLVSSDSDVGMADASMALMVNALSLVPSPKLSRSSSATSIQSLVPSKRYAPCTVPFDVHVAL